MAWGLRSVPLGHSKKSGNLPWRGCELRMCTSTPGSTKPSGPKEWGMSHIGSVRGCPENEMKMKTHQTSSIHWSPIHLSSLSKIYRQLTWMRTNWWLSNKKKKKRYCLPDYCLHSQRHWLNERIITSLTLAMPAFLHMEDDVSPLFIAFPPIAFHLNKNGNPHNCLVGDGVAVPSGHSAFLNSPLN